MMGPNAEVNSTYPLTFMTEQDDEDGVKYYAN